MSEDFEIRDLRQQDWIWTSKVLLFSKEVDDNMYRVYCALSAYSNNQTQKSFPGIETLRDKLPKGRNSIIKAIKDLEHLNLLKVERKPGYNNIYYLLDIPITTKTDNTTPVELTPGQEVKKFFQGVQDLINKTETPESLIVKELLTKVAQKYSTTSKSVIWNEVKLFSSYWTELNSTGTKQRWQKEDAFQISRRLTTWFLNKKEFKRDSKLPNTSSSKRIV